MPRQDRVDIASPLLGWFDHARRDLPWRARPGQPANPYHVLVSEAMLQQTQVTTVIPYFHRFIDAFPTIRDLARSDEQRVLRLWQGLGYYARARNLRKCAIAVVERFAGEIPRTVDELLTLPGIGRYTAGAIASIAFGAPAPIVDGNVARVLCRLDAIEEDPKSKPVIDRLWSRAAELVPEKRSGDFNQAMMELGALVCTPKNPQCLLWPLRDRCRAREVGR
ncbi:MAG TPA: A/G-specific adenine glycosylase, partial [Tepidisphaeraceae bacterium]|nr:A/G-specific adenine glycosylase [Tepidisphaeraceae bacterium]